MELNLPMLSLEYVCLSKDTWDDSETKAFQMDREILSHR